MQTLTVDGYENLQDLYDGVSDDFNAIDYTEWMRSEFDKLAQFENDQFVNATGPDGAAWPPLAPSTIKRKGHAARLVDTGRLFRSLTLRSRASAGDAVREAIQTDTAAYLGFGSTVPYGPAHDQAVGNRPARRHVGISHHFFDGMAERATDYTLKKLTDG